jgi:hypothetical protein
VSTGGSVAGTPPDGSAGAFPVALKVSDLATATKGASGGSSTQLFTVTVISSLAGWQKFHFNLPAEAALADPLADPNGNGIPNLVEYAFRLDPRSTTGPGLPHVLPAFDAAGRMRLAVSVRDDDPKLEIVLEAAPTLSFANSNLVAGVASDPVPGDGLHTLTFTDPAARADSPTRFGRLRVWILP